MKLSKSTFFSPRLKTKVLTMTSRTSNDSDLTTCYSPPCSFCSPLTCLSDGLHPCQVSSGLRDFPMAIPSASYALPSDFYPANSLISLTFLLKYAFSTKPLLIAFIKTATPSHLHISYPATYFPVFHNAYHLTYHIFIPLVIKVPRGQGSLPHLLTNIS